MRRSDLPAKNDNSVFLLDRGAFFAGKPRSYRVLYQKFAFIQPRVYTRTMLDSQCLCINLRRAARGVSRHYDGALDGFGINVAQYSLLCNLQRLNEPSISTLAEAMGLDRSTLGRNLRVLEGDGLVMLVEGEDMRNRIVRLTESGAVSYTHLTLPTIYSV